MSLYLAIDLGAESGRVIAGRFDGPTQTLELQELHRFSNLPARVNGTLCWDVLRLWNDILDGLSKAAPLGAISGIGADTWGVDFALLDANGDLLANPTHYRDARHAPFLKIAAQTVAKSEIYQRTGLQFMPFNTLYQLLALKNHKPELLNQTKTLLFMPDLLHFWLCGAKSNEYSIASTSQMLNANAREWDAELLQKFDLPNLILPALVAPASVLGTLRAEVAARTGLNLETPVIAPASHDTASAIAAVPFQTDGNAAYLSSGTWSLMGLERSSPLINDATFDLGFTNEGGFCNTIRLLKNIAGLWLVQECRRNWQREGREFSYAQLTQLAREADPNGAFIEPDDARFAAPENMAHAIQSYCRETGQNVPQTEGEIVRCALDSLALKYRWTFEKLETLRGAPLDALHIVGGGTQNQLLSQLSADCLAKPIVCGPIEATAIGNILVQAMANGEIQSAAQLRQIVRNSFPTQTFAPDPTKKAIWDAKFARFETFVR